jgi:hypothetical protein
MLYYHLAIQNVLFILLRRVSVFYAQKIDLLVWKSASLLKANDPYNKSELKGVHGKQKKKFCLKTMYSTSTVRKILPVAMCDNVVRRFQIYVWLIDCVLSTV